MKEIVILNDSILATNCFCPPYQLFLSTLLHFRWSGCDIGGYTWHGFPAFLWQVSRAKREKERKEEREESGEKKERGKREDERKWKKEKTRGKGGSKE